MVPRTGHWFFEPNNGLSNRTMVLRTGYWSFEPDNGPSNRTMVLLTWNSAWNISRCFSMSTRSQVLARRSVVVSCRYTWTRRCSSCRRCSAWVKERGRFRANKIILQQKYYGWYDDDVSSSPGFPIALLWPGIIHTAPSWHTYLILFNPSWFY